MPKLTPLLTPDQVNQAMAQAGINLSGTQAKLAAQVKVRFELDLRKRGLQTAIHNMNSRALRTAGAALMRIMSTSMRTVDPSAGSKVSTPGFPPLAHRYGGDVKGQPGRGQKLKKLIRFAVEGHPATQVIIGPIGTAGSRAPRALEFGGVSVMRKKVAVTTARGGVYRRKRGLKRQNLSPAQKAKIKAYYAGLTTQYAYIRIFVRQRPYARTALTRILRRVPRFWYNQLRAV